MGSMSTLICFLSQSVFVYMLPTSHTMCPSLPVFISLFPHFIFPTSWSQLGWVACPVCCATKLLTACEWETSRERFILLLVACWGPYSRLLGCSLPSRAHVLYCAFLTWLISFSAACNKVATYSHQKCLDRERGVMWKCKGNQSNEMLHCWISWGVFYTVWEAFISVPDPYRKLSDAETRVLISLNLYANADI